MASSSSTNIPPKLNNSHTHTRGIFYFSPLHVMDIGMQLLFLDAGTKGLKKEKIIILYTLATHELNNIFVYYQLMHINV